ncbi:MAG: apolipoprotein N-acyltransferase [Syntrophobacteraceae bacterium]|nr:apolipoprotein N-acyltransferase [Syntrophobacteraceae bacterium]
MPVSGILLSSLSGILLTAGFPFFDFYYLSWIALVPLLVAVRGRTPRQAALLGYLCGMVHYVTTMYWIRYVIYHYGGLAFPLAALILLLLCAYMSVYPAAFAFAAKKLERYPMAWVFGLPCVWVTLEFIRAHALTGFPWASLGYTQTPFSLLIQVSDITGVFGVSWVLVLAGTSLAALHYRFRAWPGLLVLALTLSATAFYGSWRIEQIRAMQDLVSPVNVAVVQGNIDQSVKWDPAFQQETLQRYRRLTLEAVKHDPQPDLVVWPETAAPFFYGIEPKLTPQLNEIVREAGKPVLFGSPAARRVGTEARLLNRTYLLEKDATVSGAYDKRHLVPFGEYVPLKTLLFFVNRLVESAGDFVPGDDPSPLGFNSLSMGILICYEGIFPGLSRDTVLRGATSLFNLTNDAWYGDTSAPYQHLEISRWRAVEFRVPLVRAANTGISVMFDATGAPCGTIPLNREGYLICNIRPIRLLTIYARWGDFFAWFCTLTAACAMLLCIYTRESESNDSQKEVSI